MGILNPGGKILGFDEHTVKGCSFSFARILIETKLKETIFGPVFIVIEGRRYELAVREIPICPYALCSLASSMEATVVVDFLAQNSRIETSACDRTWPEKEVGVTHCFAGLSVGELSIHHEEEVEVSGIVENAIINEQNTCALFPTQCTLQKKPRAEEELIAKVHKNLGLEDLGLERDLEVLTLGQATIGCEASPCLSMDVPPSFERWRRCDNGIDIDMTSEKHVYNHKESIYNRSQGCEQFLPSLKDDVVLADLVKEHKRRYSERKRKK